MRRRRETWPDRQDSIDAADRLAVQAKTDQSARNRLILQFYRLIARTAADCARKIGREDLVDDAIQAAAEETIRRIQTYDPAKSHFQQVVVAASRGAATTELQGSSQTVKNSAARRGLTIRRAYDRLSRELERPPTAAEVAGATGRAVSLETLALALAGRPQELTTDARTGMPLTDTLPHAVGGEDEIIDRISLKETAIAFDALDDLTQQVLEWRNERLSHKRIAARVGRTPAEIQQIEAQGMAALRASA